MSEVLLRVLKILLILNIFTKDNYYILIKILSITNTLIKILSIANIFINNLITF